MQNVEGRADWRQVCCVVPAEQRKGKCMAESSGARGPVKVVARYADGRVLKGTTLNFSPTRATFLLQAEGATATTRQSLFVRAI